MSSTSRHPPGLLDAATLLSAALTSLGMPRSCARILALLYLYEKPLTSKELAELTGYSKSTISAATRMLVGRRLLRKSKQGRHDIYVAEVNLSQLFLETQIGLLEHVVKKIREIRSRINSSLGRKLALVENELSSLISTFRGG